jgi:hypothetical protein
MFTFTSRPEAKFLVPNWGIQSTVGFDCRTVPPGYIGWRAGTITLCHSRLYAPKQSGTKNLASVCCDLPCMGDIYRSGMSYVLLSLDIGDLSDIYSLDLDLGSVVDRHRFDADPDADPDPDWHQDDADPHAIPTPSLSCWKSGFFFTFSRSFACLRTLVYLSHQCQTHFNLQYFGQYIKIIWKKFCLSNFISLELIPDPDTIRSDRSGFTTLLKSDNSFLDKGDTYPLEFVFRFPHC